MPEISVSWPGRRGWSPGEHKAHVGPVSSLGGGVIEFPVVYPKDGTDCRGLREEGRS